MGNLCRYAQRPFAFLLHYVKSRPVSHAAILICVLGAVGFSVGTQYGVKLIVDSLSGGKPGLTNPWPAFAVIATFIAADNLLWRVAGLIASTAFVRVTGDLRRDLFQHLMGHAPSYYADRLGGVLTSRITATSNAVFTIENMFIWNVLPPCVATFAAIGLISTVNVKMAALLAVIAIMIMILMFRIAAAGRPLHHDFAAKAAAVDGEATDVVSNIVLVKTFSGIAHELGRFTGTLDNEMAARRRSLLYLEKLRLFHAWITIVLIFCLLAWAIILWQHGQATAGQVVLVCTLGLSVLQATRDLAVALVDATQHMARLSEAISTLLVPHRLNDHPEAKPLAPAGGKITFKNVSFHYPGNAAVFEDFNLDIEAGERVGLVGPSGAGKSTLVALLQRLHDVHGGQILIDGQDISRITQQSLHEAMAFVPQDVSLFHRSVRDNIRYAVPDASDDAVWKAIVAAHCDEFVAELPLGLDTIVGDRGLNLSGGQRQRIALARAFLKDAPILLLDEATSALDHESEEAIQEASVRLMRGRTVIAIAHRLTTLSDFDRIIVLRDGKIVKAAPPQALLSADGRFIETLRHEMRRSKTRVDRNEELAAS
ncbi:ABC transporter ATP-binding protein [Methylovirgula sp. HY1]|uniref:ABC transporter ATP-binding protein n=1 Tax=Methylovirgula sp. HY1 TaxID=2822761 RepID=UPI001C5AA623|nr:ABC transporter ATP-binding protein [Methylovirgula sp. HY1]QXX73744.1 putative ABC transporter ATP-binding protein [Methylovirgula sp. HY1]